MHYLPSVMLAWGHTISECCNLCLLICLNSFCFIAVSMMPTGYVVVVIIIIIIIIITRGSFSRGSHVHAGCLVTPSAYSAQSVVLAAC